MDPVTSACEKVFADTPGRILVGFSGGMDSTVLLTALAQNSAHRSRLVALHVDHGLLAESVGWREHCERTARHLGVEYVSERLELGHAGTVSGSLEARARDRRYRVFESHLGDSDALVLAHHLGDRDESFLLHLFQGRGVFGMPERRPLGRGVLVRPFLHLSRETLRSYAEDRELSWVEDPGNHDAAMDRNYLRSEIVPRLKARFEGLSRRIDRVVRHTAATERALVEALELDRHPLPMSVLNGLSRPAAVSVIRHWLIRQQAVTGIGDAAIVELLRQLDADNDRQPALETTAGTLRRYRRQLYLVPAPPELETSYELAVPGTLNLPHGTLSAQAGNAGPALTVRFLEDCPPGLSLRVNGHEQKVREVLRAAAVPPWERPAVPLVFDREGLLAVAGLAVRDGSGGVIFRWMPDPEISAREPSRL
jgi:tRNA(Ile)-lysidine synthase